MGDLSRKPLARYKRDQTTDTYSTIALNFSAALDDIFNLDSSSDLARSVEQK